MAFSDPINLVVSSVTYPFIRIDDGYYSLSSSSADEPVLLNLQRTLVPGGTSSYVVKYTKNKNVVATPPQVDDVLQVHTVIKYPHRSFSQADVELGFNLIGNFMSSANITKLLRGER
jgi:hypothetical protein